MKGSEPAVISPVSPDDAEAIEAMARAIWPLVYSDLISTSQIAYMLDWMYAPDRIREEIANEGISYFWILSGRKKAGFLAGGSRENGGEFDLHKIYVHPDYHGRSVASKALEAFVDHVRNCGGREIHLRVNRENERALSFYRKHGFSTEGEDKAAIGDGFFMDDFLLVKRL